MKKNTLKIISLLFIFLLTFLNSTITYANTTQTYEEIAQKITGATLAPNKINIFFFNGDGCPHCHDEKIFFKSMENKYPGKINILSYEVWYNDTNGEYLRQIFKEANIDNNGIPLTIIGNKHFTGFSETIEDSLIDEIEKYINNNNTVEEKDNHDLHLPFLGKVNVKEISIPLTAFILGTVDGFNPCAMWVLLFLITMLLNMTNKKRKWLLGITFLLASASIYFLSLLGINFVLNIISINLIKTLISVVILVFGLLNIKKYIQNRKKENGCSVVDKNKRKKIMTKVKDITEQNSFILALVGVSLLAINVNLVELSCSLGFPVVFNEILTINQIEGSLKIIYLLIYIFFYMIDDIVVFVISMVTLEATGITNKYNKICTLISGIIMTLMGLLLLVKPEWLMLNF